jgi:hypothetical protein
MRLEVARSRSRSMSSLIEESFLDVRVRGGDVRFRLVVVVVRDEVLDGVAREELLELAVQLRGERLVVAHHQRGLPQVGDDVRHGERLPGTGGAQQRLVLVAALEALGKLLDGPRLVARGEKGDTSSNGILPRLRTTKKARGIAPPVTPNKSRISHRTRAHHAGSRAPTPQDPRRIRHAKKPHTEPQRNGQGERKALTPFDPRHVISSGAKRIVAS